MDRKKKKMVAKTWRPVSTQSRSTESDKKHDIGGQVQETKCTVSSHESRSLAEDCEAEVANDVVDTNRSPKATHVREGIDLEGQTAPSAEPLSAAQKHSVTVKAGASLMVSSEGKVIEGYSAERVARASNRVQAVIDETVKSRNLDYSHFISLPLAIHPELVNKLINFQNSVLGITVVNQDENLECDSNGKTTDSEGEEQNLSERRVAVELKTEDSNDCVKVDITNIPLVGYSPKASKSSIS